MAISVPPVRIDTSTRQVVRDPVPRSLTEAELMRGYGAREPFEAVVMDRISELWTRRTWYQTHLGWIVQQAVDDRAELLLLVRLARQARRHLRTRSAELAYGDFYAGMDR
jgi:hypothetical protein